MKIAVEGSFSQPPQLFILAGPNGAGKSTTARVLLPETLGIEQFVNADNIAAGLSPFAPQTAAMEASRIMLNRIRVFLQRRQSLAFETTLAGRSTLPLLRDAVEADYSTGIVFIWLRSPDLAVRRVADRVALGGHSVPTETIVRRYHRGLVNFWDRYRELVQVWTLCDNSETKLVEVARGSLDNQLAVLDAGRWSAIQESVRNARVQTKRSVP